MFSFLTRFFQKPITEPTFEQLYKSLKDDDFKAEFRDIPKAYRALAIAFIYTFDDRCPLEQETLRALPIPSFSTYGELLDHFRHADEISRSEEFRQQILTIALSKWHEIPPSQRITELVQELMQQESLNDEAIQVIEHD